MTPNDLPFELIVTAPGFLNEEREIDENSVNGLVTIQLRNPQGAISGKVISSEDGRPAKGVSLSIRGSAEGRIFGAWANADSETGFFEFPDLPAGSLELTLSQTLSDGIFRRPVRRTIEIRPGQILEGLVVALP